MAKDYKGRGGRRRPAGRGGRSSTGRAAGGRSGRGRTPAGRTAPGWQYLLAGLAMGLLVAAGVFVFDRLPGTRPIAGGNTAPATPRPAPADPADAQEPTPAAPPEPEYDFYELLPRYEVVIAEEETGVAGGTAPAVVDEPGTYVLQAGSFRNHADADRMQATLALQGIESRIQVVTIDADQAWHRVRIGPVEDLRELDRLRERLRRAGVEFLVIRVGGQ